MKPWNKRICCFVGGGLWPISDFNSSGIPTCRFRTIASPGVCATTICPCDKAWRKVPFGRCCTGAEFLDQELSNHGNRGSLVQSAVIYCLDVETFMDANADGVGDLEGLIRRLYYLAGSGVTCVWLQPFHGSPNHDNGYDVMDYYGVDLRRRSLGDFVEFMNHARAVGSRVIIDLV